MRGALGGGLSKAAGLRIIPADAGSTPHGTSDHTSSRDHPRRCGEHVVFYPQSGDKEGSSPQMRGALPPSTTPADPTRIIPADAGSTLSELSVVLAARDHPRRCGEHSDSDTTKLVDSGSSPQMRGARRKPEAGQAAAGIIPADAGSTCWCLPFSYPFQGSSPQMRGARNVTWDASYRDRIIPADAGSTLRRGSSRIFRWDHPRRCGEHLCGKP